MGNGQSDVPLVRMQLNLKDCFVSQCCGGKEVKGKEEKEQTRDEVDNANINTSSSKAISAPPSPSCCQRNLQHRTQSL